MNEYKLLNVSDVSKILGLSERTIWSLLGKQIPKIQIGRSIRIDPADLNAYIQSHRTGGGHADR